MNKQSPTQDNEWFKLTRASFYVLLFLLVGCEPTMETVEHTNDQSKLAKIAVEAKTENIRDAAFKKLTNQPLLAKIAVEQGYGIVSHAAMERLTDHALLAKVAVEAVDWEVRRAALQKLADDKTLLANIGIWVNPELTRQVNDQILLAKIATEALDRDVRRTAVSNLTDQASLAKIAVEDKDIIIRRDALGKIDDQTLLAKIAVEDKDMVIRRDAVRWVFDQTLLEQVALRSIDREILKIVLGRLNKKGILSRIAHEASDPAMRLAADQESGARTWKEIFDAATNEEMRGDALAAVSLFASVQTDAIDSIQSVCLGMIRRGDLSRIPEMVELLEGYGDKTLAEDYLNSGQSYLNAAAREWFHRRGYTVVTGNGSRRATWGNY